MGVRSFGVPSSPPPRDFGFSSEGPLPGCGADSGRTRAQTPAECEVPWNRKSVELKGAGGLRVQLEGRKSRTDLVVESEEEKRGGRGELSPAPVTTPFPR